MSVNNRNGVNEGANNMRESQSDIKKRFIRDFVKEETTGDKENEKNKFLDEVFDNNTITSDLKNKIEGKMNGGVSTTILGLNGANYNKYEGLNIKDIKINDLKNATLRDNLSLNKKRRDIKSSVLKKYEITNKAYGENVEKEIKKLPVSELEKLGNRRLLDAFLSKILKKDKPEPREFLNIFSQLKGKDLKELDKKTNGKLMDIIHDLGENHGSGQYNPLSSTDLVAIRDLFRYEVLSEDFKIKFLKHYISEVSLEDYKKIFNISESEIKQKKRELLKVSFPHFNGNQDEINHYADQINNSEVFINITNIESSPRNLVRILNSTHVLVDTLERYGEDHNFENKFLEEKSKELKEQSEKESQKNVESVVEKSFEEKLKEKGVENFKEGNIVVLKLKNEETGEEKTSFLEIISLNNKNGEIHLIEKSEENQYQKSRNKSIVSSEENILNLFETKEEKIEETGEKNKQKKGKNEKNTKKTGFQLKTFECYSDADFQKKLSDPDNKELVRDRNEIEFISEADLEEKRKEVTKERKKELLVEEAKIPKDISDEELEKHTDFKKFALDRGDEKLQKKFREVEEVNLNILKDKVDELDVQGRSFGFGEGVTFETPPDKEGRIGIYTISKIDLSGFADEGSISGEPGVIHVVSVEGEKYQFSFRDFFEGWKQDKPFRTSKLNNMEEVFASVNGYAGIGEKWGNFELKDNKICKKDGKEEDGKKKYEYNFLVSTKSEELLKIHSIEGDTVMVSFGEAKQDKDKKTTFGVDDAIHRVNIGFLDTWIKKHSLVPRSRDEEKDLAEEKTKGAQRSGNFWSKLGQRWSVADMLAGGKLYLDSIENYLKEGQEEMASRFANSLWLPEEIKADMKAREDAAKKKRMDEYITKLKEGADSGEAVEMIVGWLLNKDAPEFKKEAGLVFMMEKYGVLYGKKGLMKHKGEFLWYKALGGTVGDDLYRSVEKEEKEKNQPFTEERLVWILVLRQCKKGGYNGITRRSRLYKEIEGLMKKGFKDEVEDGLEKSGSVSNSEDQIESGMEELRSGNYPTAVGWMKGSFNRGGSVKDINKLPFVMLFSGEAYSMTEDARNTIRGIGASEHHLVPILGFFRKNSQIGLINNTILELARRIAEKTGNKKIYTDALTIKNEAGTFGDNLAKINRCEKFYDTYGEIIMNSLYGLHVDTKDTYLNHIIEIEKEPHEDKNGKQVEGNNTFGEYAKAYGGMDTIHPTDDHMNYQYKDAGWTGFDTLHMMEFALSVIGSGGALKNPQSSIGIMTEFYEHTQRIKMDGSLDGSLKKTLVSNKIVYLLGAIIKNGIDGVKKSNEIVVYLRKYGINLDVLKKKGFSEHSVLHPEEGSEEEKYINSIVRNILGEKAGGTKSGDTSYSVAGILGGKEKAPTPQGDTSESVSGILSSK